MATCHTSVTYGGQALGCQGVRRDGCETQGSDCQVTAVPLKVSRASVLAAGGPHHVCHCHAHAPLLLLRVRVPAGCTLRCAAAPTSCRSPPSRAATRGQPHCLARHRRRARRRRTPTHSRQAGQLRPQPRRACSCWCSSAPGARWRRAAPPRTHLWRAARRPATPAGRGGGPLTRQRPVAAGRCRAASLESPCSFSRPATAIRCACAAKPSALGRGRENWKGWESVPRSHTLTGGTPYGRREHFTGVCGCLGQTGPAHHIMTA
jgi:hypothetical protein